MNFTVTLDEPLASQLCQEASARQLSPEEAASELLGNLPARMATETAWRRANQRRLELIRKGRDGSSTAEEQMELDQLQAAADLHLAPMDQRLLAEADQFRRIAEGNPDATAP